MNKILITGGCGFLGSNIASHYLGKGWKVVVIDKLFRKGGEQNKAWLENQANENQLTIYVEDLAEEDKVNQVFEELGPFDYVCHLGGQVAMTTSLEDPRRDLLTNVVGTFNVLEAVRKYCSEAFVAYSSTNKVYGDLESIELEETATRFSPAGHAGGFNESMPLDFASPYGCSKGSADQYMRDWCRNYGLKTVVFRHSSIFGGRQFSTFDQGWLGWFCRQAQEQKADATNTSTFTISGTGKQVRDVLHASDLIALYEAAYNKRDIATGKIFNIGGGVSNSLSLLELFEMLEGMLDIKMQFTRLPRRQSDQDYFVADISKAKRLLDWEPKISKEEGIRKMLNWVDQII